MEKNLEYYSDLPYNIHLQKKFDYDGSVYYFIKILELDGCQSDGKTVHEAYDNLNIAFRMYIETCLKYGDKIPEPINDNNFSGKFNIRIPYSLHRDLSIEAKIEGISLNQYVLYCLAKRHGNVNKCEHT